MYIVGIPYRTPKRDINKGGIMSKNPKQAYICGHHVKIGDYVRVRYETGKRMKGCEIWGVITNLWSPEMGDDHLLVQVNNGWCFHNHDTILEHKEA